jgi:hypothetical protein
VRQSNVCKPVLAIIRAVEGSEPGICTLRPAESPWHLAACFRSVNAETPDHLVIRPAATDGGSAQLRHCCGCFRDKKIIASAVVEVGRTAKIACKKLLTALVCLRSAAPCLVH